MADRLLSNFGHDILDALFWTATEPRGRRREHLGTLPHLVLAIIYVSILYELKFVQHMPSLKCNKACAMENSYFHYNIILQN